MPRVLRISFLLAMTVILLVCTPAASAFDGSQKETGKLVEVRQSVVRGYPLSRYASIHVYAMYFTVKTASNTYCVEYDTQVLDEVKSLRESSGKDVQIDVEGKKKIHMVLPDNTQFKAQLQPTEQC
jgi:hypothetical protein